MGEKETWEYSDLRKKAPRTAKMGQQKRKYAKRRSIGLKSGEKKGEREAGEGAELSRETNPFGGAVKRRTTLEGET